MAVIHVTSENFPQVVLQADRPVLVDFWATWCGPCRMLGPVLEEIAEERQDILVAKVNVEEDMSLAQQYGITSIPAVFLFENGSVVNRSVGYRPKSDILSML